METINNIALDLLFRIDFFALTGFGENGFEDDKMFEVEKQKWKDKYQIKSYHQRGFQGYEYVRLSELELNIKPYFDYLIDLNSISKFDCCQLEQGIGLFENNELKAFLSTDSGLCYNSPAHFDSVADIFKNGESNLTDFNTFYGKAIGEYVELQYSPKSNNIDIDKIEEIVSMKINKNDFEIGLKQLIERTNEFFLKLKPKLKSEMKKKEEMEFVEEVFKEIN